MHVMKTSYWDNITVEHGVTYLVIKLQPQTYLKSLKFPTVYSSQISL